jgi:hypothetical protein
VWDQSGRAEQIGKQVYNKREIRAGGQTKVGKKKVARKTIRGGEEARDNTSNVTKMGVVELSQKPFILVAIGGKGEVPIMAAEVEEHGSEGRGRQR